jgi:hypothetical protein
VNKPRLFVDVDACEEAVISAHRNQGIDVLTVLDVDRAGIGDDDQFQFASSIGRAVYSLNARHFARLNREFLTRGEHHAGIIVIPRQRYSIGEKIRCLVKFLETTDAESLIDTMHFL